jgi:hypothetical protein
VLDVVCLAKALDAVCLAKALDAVCLAKALDVVCLAKVLDVVCQRFNWVYNVHKSNVLLMLQTYCYVDLKVSNKYFEFL